MHGDGDVVADDAVVDEEQQAREALRARREQLQRVAREIRRGDDEPPEV